MNYFSQCKKSLSGIKMKPFPVQLVSVALCVLPVCPPSEEIGSILLEAAL